MSTDDLQFHVLGPLRVTRAGTEVDLRGDKPRAVLALLLTRRDRVVPATALADEIWGEDVDGAHANLQVLISNLRRVLEGQRYIRTAPRGYLASVPDDDFDLARFRARSVEGGAARAARRAPEAAQAYGAALGEWSGARALEGLGSLAFADAFAESLHQEVLSALQARVEADLACGRQLQVLGELHELTLRFPLSDVFCGQLITALAASGRAADAAEQYHQFRERYQQELGAHVPEPLRRIWTSVSRHETPPDHYSSSTTRSRHDHTLVDDDLAQLHGELVHSDGARVGFTGRVSIGRIDCNVVLADPKVSKTHAMISPTPEGFVISDLHSTNGTFVNDERLAGPRRLEHLDRIRVGNSELVFRLAST